MRNLLFIICMLVLIGVIILALIANFKVICSKYPKHVDRKIGTEEKRDANKIIDDFRAITDGEL